MMIIIGGTGIFGAAYEYYKTGAFRDSLIVLLWCIGGETLSLFIYSLMGIGENKRILSCRIKDYLENSLAHRMKREEEKSRRINLDIHRGKKPEAAAPVAATLAADESEEKKKPEPDKGQGTGRKKKKEIDISDEMLEQLLASVIG
jgi:hypothetical protein